MKIKYLLKKKAKGSYLAYVALYGNSQTELISTDQRTTLSAWTEKSGKNGRMPIDQASDLFHDVEKVKTGVTKVMRLMNANEQEVTPFTLKQEYEKTIKAKQAKQHTQDKHDKVNLTAISSLIDKWIKKDEEGNYMHLHGDKPYKPSTQRVVVTSIKMFQDYLKLSGNQKLERKELTLDIISAYAHHLQVKKKLKDSTHGKRMKHLRWFLKYIKFDGGQIKEVKIRTVKPDQRNIIHLSMEELAALEGVDVTYDKDLQRAKDMFLLGCYSGLRISDLKRISKHRIKNGAIEMTLQKNNKFVSIPLLAQAKEILQRYDYGAPKISEQQVNKNIKTVCDKAGIDEPIHFKSVKAGVVIEKLHPKHELITSHCASKTFISLAAKKWNLTPTDVAAIVGKNVAVVLSYYWKTDLEEAKNKIVEAEQRRIEAANRSQMAVVGKKAKAS